VTGRSEPPFRADHVGSLLRPARLMEARARRAAGDITADDLRAVEDSAIRDVVAMQRDVGLQSATDGEFRRSAWHMDFIYQLGGVTQADEQLHVQFFNAGGTLDFAPAALRINDRITLREPIFADHFRFL
jgi:5-methyltetrahydropteroyltriglutamate--homocysteine methyltransferase